MTYDGSNRPQDLKELSTSLKQLLKAKKEYAELNNRPDVYPSVRISVNDPKNRVKEVPLLHYLVQHSTNQAMIDKLLLPTLNIGLNVNILDSSNENILHAFFKKKRMETGCHCKLVKTFVERGVKIVQANSTSGATPLHYLVSRKEPQSCDCISTLMRAATEQTQVDYLHVVNASGHSALHLAILYNNPLFVKQLLDQGANPVQQTHQGLKPLHLACQLGSREPRGPKEILAQLIVGLLENSNNFQLNEKTISGGLDPLDLLLKEVAYPEGKTAESELLECIRLLLDIAFIIRQRHLAVVKQHI